MIDRSKTHEVMALQTHDDLARAQFIIGFKRDLRALSAANATVYANEVEPGFRDDVCGMVTTKAARSEHRKHVSSIEREAGFRSVRAGPPGSAGLIASTGIAANYFPEWVCSRF